MLFKGKNQDYEIDFEANVDLGYWALLVSICHINMPKIGCLDSGHALILRVLCFQFSWELWKWGENREITDVETSIEEILDELK